MQADTQSTDWTAEELEALPQTTQVFDIPKLEFDNHQWFQKGYYIYDSCDGCIEQAIPIPSGKMLMKEGGHYTLIDE